MFFQCDKCEYKAANKSYLNTLMIEYHGFTEFYCDKCEREFLSAHSLSEHTKLHCDQCNQLFGNIMQLKKHETISGHY